MKKHIKNIFFCAIIIFLIPKFTISSKAQDFSFDKAYQDYQHNLTQYQKAFSEYDYAKNAYIMNSTLNLKDDVRLKMLDLLTTRDELIRVYLTMLRMRIVENNGLTNDEKNSIFLKIDKEIEFYNNDKTKYSTNDSLTTLFSRNEELENRYKFETHKIIKEVIAYVSLGEEISLRLNHEQIYTNLRLLIDSRFSSNELVRTQFGHWFNDIDATIQIITQNEKEVRQEIDKIELNSQSKDVTCEPCNEILSYSIVSLSQYNGFLTEMINFIKNQP